MSKKKGHPNITFEKTVELVLDAIEHQELNKKDFLLHEVYDLYMIGNPPHMIVKLLRK